MKTFTKLAVGISTGFASFFMLILLPVLIVAIIIVAAASSSDSSSSSNDSDEEEDTSSAEIIESNGLYFESDCTAFCYPLATDRWLYSNFCYIW